MGDFHLPVNRPHLIYSLDLRREPTVDAQYAVVHQCPQGQVIEGLIEILPRSGAPVLLYDLIVKPINSRNLSGFVVPPEEQDILGELDLVAEEQLDRLHGIVPPIYKIADEDVSGLGELPAHLEEFQHVEELPVDIAAYGHWSLRLLDIRFLEEQLLDLVAQTADGSFLEVLAGLQLGDPSIHLHHLNCRKIYKQHHFRAEIRLYCQTTLFKVPRGSTYYP